MLLKTPTNQLKVADQCWVGLALLHRDYPHRAGFTPEEILQRIQQDAGGTLRPGVRTHISSHNVANVPPNPGNYRMYFRQADGTYRLFRLGDPASSRRRGKLVPDRDDLPSDLVPLLDWYEKIYCKSVPGDAGAGTKEDPVLAMLGVGKHLWTDESGDEFIRKERQDW